MRWNSKKKALWQSQGTINLKLPNRRLKCTQGFTQISSNLHLPNILLQSTKGNSAQKYHKCIFVSNCSVKHFSQVITVKILRPVFGFRWISLRQLCWLHYMMDSIPVSIQWTSYYYSLSYRRINLILTSPHQPLPKISHQDILHEGIQQDSTSVSNCPGQGFLYIYLPKPHFSQS